MPNSKIENKAIEICRKFSKLIILLNKSQSLHGENWGITLQLYTITIIYQASMHQYNQNSQRNWVQGNFSLLDRENGSCFHGTLFIGNGKHLYISFLSHLYKLKEGYYAFCCIL